MRRLVHFEIHATEPARVLPFYTTLFGWTAEKLPGPVDYWLLTTGAPGDLGVDGALLRRHGAPPPEGQPVNAFVCTVDVASVDDVETRLSALGGTVAVPKMAIPGVGWLLYIKDPDGNILGVMQADSLAK